MDKLHEKYCEGKASIQASQKKIIQCKGLDYDNSWSQQQQQH